MMFNPNDFKLINVVSNGPHGTVFRANWQKYPESEEKVVAVKIVILSQETEYLEKEVNQLEEIFSVITALDHKNVVLYLDSFYASNANENDFPKYYFIMEYCEGGSLYDAIKQKTEARCVQKWAKEILFGLAYLHKIGIIHRDLKTSHILLTSKNRNDTSLKISGLGSLKRIANRNSHIGEGSYRVGTWRYMSPEMMDGDLSKVIIRRKTDIWSFGCIILDMLLGSTSFYKGNAKGERVELRGDMAILYYVSNGGKPYIPASEYPEKITSFVHRCIQHDPDQRPDAAELLEDSFITAPEEEVSQWHYPDNRAAGNEMASD